MIRKTDGRGGGAGAGGGMPPDGKAVAAAVREQRLKVALKANMARRKAQAKARSGGAGDSGAVGGETAAARSDAPEGRTDTDGD